VTNAVVEYYKRVHNVHVERLVLEFVQDFAKRLVLHG
jgi:hypothetical protein